MTGAVVPFDFGSTTIRTVLREGEPWFVGRDVATVLGYGTPAQALQDHRRSCDKMSLESPAGLRETTIIPERDVYRLIMRSRLPAAVGPEFRKGATVGYILTPRPIGPASLPQAPQRSSGRRIDL